jgi:hypothetical protein
MNDINWEFLSWVGVIGYILISSIVWSVQRKFFGNRKLHSVRWIYHICFWLGVVGFFFSKGIVITLVSVICMWIGSFLMGIIVDESVVLLRKIMDK